MYQLQKGIYEEEIIKEIKINVLIYVPVEEGYIEEYTSDNIQSKRPEAFEGL